ASCPVIALFIVVILVDKGLVWAKYSGMLTFSQRFVNQEGHDLMVAKVHAALRLDEDLRNRLKAEAVSSNRTVSQEMEARLQASFAASLAVTDPWFAGVFAAIGYAAAAATKMLPADQARDPVVYAAFEKIAAMLVESARPEGTSEIAEGA